MHFRPCIDLYHDAVVQIVGSTLSDANADAVVRNFVSEKTPAWYAARYRNDGLFGGHVIMLGPGNEEAACEALAAFPGGLQVGGGMTPDNCRRFLDAGASHIIVTSYVFKDGIIDWERLREFVAGIGADRLTLDLSCKYKDGAYFIVTNRWQTFTTVAVDERSLALLADSCAEFLVHGVDVEGKRGGIDENLVSLLARYASLPVTYAGGIRSIEDLERIAVIGKGRIDATVGSALDLFGGSLPYRDVVAWHHAQENAGR